MLNVTCRRCGEVFHVPDDAAGQRVHCPKCGNRFTMDDTSAAKVELEYARYPLATLLEVILVVVAVIGGIRVLMSLAEGHVGAAFANLIITVGATFGAVLLSIATQAARNARTAAHYCRKLAEREIAQ